MKRKLTGTNNFTTNKIRGKGENISNGINLSKDKGFSDKKKI